MKTISFRIAVVVIWLGLMAWLIRYEAYPHFFTHTITGYGSLIPKDVLVIDSWMKLVFKGATIGYSHTSLETDEENPLQRYGLLNTMHLKMKIMGEDKTIDVDTAAYLDAMYDLQRFSFELTSPGYALKANAVRANAKSFNVRVSTGSSIQKMRVDIPSDVVLYSPMTEMAMKQLSPGQYLTIKSLDPATLTTSMVTIRALRKETLVLDGKTYDTTVLSTELKGVQMLAWIDSEGSVLRQETPFGWTLEKCTPEEAMKILQSSVPGADMLAAMAVPCIGTLRSPDKSARIRLKLSGVNFKRTELETPRQTVTAEADGTIELSVLAAKVPGAIVNDGASADSLKPFLAASNAIQSDNPEIMKRARKITEDSATPLEKAKAIFEWVYRNVDKEITVSLPSALDVLHTMKGDCNEHTYLFVALARAAGLPAQVNVGLVFKDGAFYYHAWPSVHIGEWLEMDPTWGQEGVDATHISLVRGELDQQFELVRVMGQLKVEVIGEDSND